MVKKSVGKKTKNNGLANIWQKHWQKILVGVVFVGIIGFIGVNQLIIYNQKQQYVAAEESLDALYADIVKQTGQPTSVTKDKSCSYRSQKIGRGERSCRVGYVANYNNITDVTASKELALSIESKLKTSNIVTFMSSYPGYKTPVNEFNTTDEFKLDNTKLECHASYVLNPKTTENNNFLVFFISCGGPTRSELYPVKN